MKVATAAYPLDWLDSWSQYEDKLAHWVADAAKRGAELLVFPEYGAMELATLDGPETAGDLEKSLWAVADRLEEADALHVKLAAEHNVHILAASAPARFEADPGGRPVNRARLITPKGGIGIQDKQIMTRFEREDWDVIGGGPLRVFETTIGRIGVLICYDSEFPLLARPLAEAGMELLLVPSCTDTVAGFHRVRIGAMARALECQCVVVHAPTVGDVDWNPAIDVNHGRAAIYGPPDGFWPETGIIAEGAMDEPGWVMARIDLSRVARSRADGAVLPFAHWPESEKSRLV